MSELGTLCVLALLGWCGWYLVTGINVRRSRRLLDKIEEGRARSAPHLDNIAKRRGD